MSFQVGQVVDHYRLDRVVATTASVTMFEAFDLRLLRRVALKVLAPGLSAAPAFRARFARDAARAAELDHPGIASVFDSNESAGSLYFVTKLVDGVSLREVAHRGRVPVADAITYLEQVAGALDYAHRRGVVHGRVGLAAVLIASDDADGSAVLFDVGIDKQLTPPDADDGEARQDWFPPATGEWSPTGPAAEPEARRVDLVGLARMAFELLTRRAPQDALAGASMLEPSLPSGVDEVFAAVFGDADRGMSCTGFVNALRRQLPTASLIRQAPPPRGGPTAASAAASPASSGTVDGPPRRAVLAVGVTVAVLLVAGVLLWQGTRSTDVVRGAAPASALTPVTSAQPAPTTVRPTTTAPRRTTTVPPTTAAPTTAAPTTAAPISAAPTEAPTTAAPALNMFGDVVGQPVTEPASAEGRAAVGLQQRRAPAEVAAVDTPAAYYAQWLRLTTPVPATPVVATGDGYAIDAGVPAVLNQFQVGESGQVVSFVECTSAACTSVTGGIELSGNCEPGPGCAAFATDDTEVLAVVRATVTLRSPAITLLFSVTSNGMWVAGVSDPYNTTRWDGETATMSITLATPPPPGTQMSVTFTYEDGSRSQMAITYG